MLVGGTLNDLDSTKGFTLDYPKHLQNRSLEPIRN